MTIIVHRNDGSSSKHTITQVQGSGYDNTARLRVFCQVSVQEFR